MLKTRINKLKCSLEKDRKTKLIDRIKWEISYEDDVKRKQLR